MDLRTRRGVADAVKNRIKELRDRRGWTQADLASRLDISRQTVNALEAERWDPSLPLAFAIAELFGESVDTMFAPGPDPRRAGQA